MNSKKKVFITGLTGFLASHVCKILLEQGHEVKGSVRDLKSKKCDDLKKENVFGIQGARLEIIEADITNKKGWKEALEGCHYLIHMASPVPKGDAYFKDLSVIDTAIEGTKNVLEAAVGIVERVVLTSSSAAVIYPGGKKNDLFDFEAAPLDEDDWTKTENSLAEIGAYSISKTKAERWAWDFAKSKNLQLTTINPTFVIGPLLSSKIRAQSLSMIYFASAGKINALPKQRILIPYVDVRDVALAHVTSLTHEQAPGNRYILHNEFYDLVDMLEELKDEFKPLSLNWPKRSVPYWKLKLASLFKQDAKMLLSLMGPSHEKYRSINGKKVNEHFNFSYRPLKDTMRDCIQSFKDIGLIK